MTQQQRLNLVLELVSKRGSVPITEISEKLDVSTAAVRRDPSTLAEQWSERSARPVE